MLTHIEDLIGQTIGRYHLLRVLGRGGAGTVFLARPEAEADAEKLVAVKILFPQKYSSPEAQFAFQLRFARETRVMRQLKHKHIVPLQDSGETSDGLFYLVMPYLAGGSFNMLLRKQEGALPLKEIACYARQMAEALDYIHSHHVVHCDIKPGNVLLDQEGNVYIADFGIARLLENGSDDLNTVPMSLTAPDEVFGTPSYMAPEIFRGERANKASDIYALGVMLYRLVTGQVPFSGKIPVEIGIRQINEQPDPPRSLRADLPVEAEDAILRALAKAPSARFPSAGALASAFEAGVQEKVTVRLEQPAFSSTTTTAEQVEPVVAVDAPEFEESNLDEVSATIRRMAPILAATARTRLSRFVDLCRNEKFSPLFAAGGRVYQLIQLALAWLLQLGLAVLVELSLFVTGRVVPAYKQVSTSLLDSRFYKKLYLLAAPVARAYRRAGISDYLRLRVTLTGMLFMGLLTLTLIAGFSLGRMNSSSLSSFSSLQVSQHAKEKSTNARATPTRPHRLAPSAGSSVFDMNLLSIGVDSRSVYALRLDTNTVIWRYRVSGQAISPVTTTRTNVYFVTSPGIVFALRLRDGKLLWSNDLSDSVSVPLRVSDNTISVAADDGSFYQLNASTGELLSTS